MHPLTRCMLSSKPACILRVDILNTCYKLIFIQHHIYGWMICLFQLLKELKWPLSYGPRCSVLKYLLAIKWIWRKVVPRCFCTSHSGMDGSRRGTGGTFPLQNQWPAEAMTSRSSHIGSILLALPVRFQNALKHAWNLTKSCMYRVGQKKVSLCCLHITSSNTGRFSKFFHCHILQEICNKVIIKYSTSPQTCRYTTLWNIYVIKIACSARCGNLAKRWTLQNPDSWQAAAAVLNKMYWLLLLSLFSCINFRYCLELLADDFPVNSNSLIINFRNDFH